MSKTARGKGREIEKNAERFLNQRGLKTITCNYQVRSGEIDLIMQDKNTIVFVEVRYRKSKHWGTALESIDQHKQARIISTAHHYLEETQSPDSVRFDVVTYDHDTETPTEWIRDAFYDE